MYTTKIQLYFCEFNIFVTYIDIKSKPAEFVRYTGSYFTPLIFVLAQRLRKANNIMIFF